MRLALSALLLGLGAFAQPAPAPPKKNAPSAQRRERELIAALPDEDREWLTDYVAPIILPEEKKAYLELTEGYQREDFREAFWQRRERPDLPPLFGPGYRYRYRELRELLDSRYDGWRSDASKVVIRFGEPSEILTPRCDAGGDEDFRDLEVWTYRTIGTWGRGEKRFIFYRPFLGSPRRMWTLQVPDSQVFVPHRCRRSFPELFRDCSLKGSLRDPGGCMPCEDRCRVFRAWDEIQRRQGGQTGALIEEATLLQEPPLVSTEDLPRQREKWATTSRPGARKIDVQGPGTAVTAPPALSPTPDQGPLSGDELKRRIAALPVRHQEFLDAATPLIRNDEIVEFVRMPSDKRDEFIREFWSREKGPAFVPPTPHRQAPTPRTTRLEIIIRVTPTPGG